MTVPQAKIQSSKSLCVRVITFTELKIYKTTDGQHFDRFTLKFDLNLQF